MTSQFSQFSQTYATLDRMSDQNLDHHRPDHTVDRATGVDQDRFGKNGMLLVGLAAAVLSFQIWVQLAQSVGFTAHWSIHIPQVGWAGGVVLSFWIAWLYPVSIDVYAALVTREWLRSAPGSHLRTWAKANSIGAIGLSFMGQGAYHAFADHHPPTWFIIAMGGMPPLVVGLTVHLYTMRGRTSAATMVRPDQPSAPTARTKAEPDRTSRPKSQPDQAPDQTTASTPVDQSLPPSNVRELRPVQNGSVVDQMAAAIDQSYRSTPLPSRRNLMDHMKTAAPALKWTSADQVQKAINEVKRRRSTAVVQTNARREADTPPAADQTGDSDDQDRLTAGATA